MRASMRSSAAIDCSALAGKLFGGGGHPRAAGFRIKEFENFELAVLDCVQKLKTGMQEQKNAGAESPVRTQTKIQMPADHTIRAPGEPFTPPPQGKDFLREMAGQPENPQTDGMDVVGGLTA